MANPRFMKKTRNAVKSTQAVSMPTCIDFLNASSASDVTAAAGDVSAANTFVATYSR